MQRIEGAATVTVQRMVTGAELVAVEEGAQAATGAVVVEGIEVTEAVTVAVAGGAQDHFSSYTLSAYRVWPRLVLGIEVLTMYSLSEVGS